MTPVQVLNVDWGFSLDHRWLAVDLHILSPLKDISQEKQVPGNRHSKPESLLSVRATSVGELEADVGVHVRNAQLSDLGVECAPILKTCDGDMLLVLPEARVSFKGLTEVVLMAPLSTKTVRQKKSQRAMMLRIMGIYGIAARNTVVADICCSSAAVDEEGVISIL